MVYFSQLLFSVPQKKTLDYSLWFIQNFDETVTSPKLYKKAYQAKALSKRNRMTLVSAS